MNVQANETGRPVTDDEPASREEELLDALYEEALAACQMGATPELDAWRARWLASLTLTS